MDHIKRRDAELPYISDEAVMAEQKRTRRILQELNRADMDDFDTHVKAAKQLVKSKGKLYIAPPFYCDYGHHIEVGDNFFSNYNCTILDVAKVTIGDNTMFGPNVAVYTAGHPLHPVSRNSGYEYGIAVTIGSNVWIGGNVVVMPGVTIGDSVVIGAGSVVTKDIPANTVAAGNPCKVIREITEEDKQYYYRERKFDEESWKEIEEYSRTLK